MPKRVLAWLALTASAATPVFAQAAARGVIDGTVTDTSLTPVAAAQVDIVGYSISVATGTNGRFRILSLAAGDYLISVRRVGYSPSVTPVHVDGDTVGLPSNSFQRRPNSQA